jgi:hypothetical protein
MTPPPPAAAAVVAAALPPPVCPQQLQQQQITQPATSVNAAAATTGVAPAAAATAAGGGVTGVTLVTRQAPKGVTLVERLRQCREGEGGRMTFGKSGIHGWGIFAKVAIKQGTMVTEFRGELCSPVVADLREKMYRKQVRAGRV